MKSERPTSPALGARAAILGLLAIAFTLLMVNYSRLYGRLLFLPVVDDVAYMDDALERLKVLYTSGFWGLITGYADAPPHSPFSSGLAMISFALLGLHEWAPYIGNVIIVFALVGFAAVLMRGAMLWEQLLACVFVLTTPLAANAVSDFRPDVACGVATAAGLVLLLAKPFAQASLRYRLVIGACLGGALLAKPSISPLTLALFATALTLALLCDLRLEKPRPSLRKLITACLPLAAVAALMAIPHYAVAWRNIADYIQRHMVGSSSTLWEFRGGASAHARYFLDGPGGAYMLGSHLWILLGLAVLGAVLAPRLGALSITRLAGFGLVVLVAYLVPTLSWAKNPYIAVVFHVLLVFSGVLVLRVLVTSSHARGARSGRLARVSGRAALIVVVLLGIWLAKFPGVWGTRGSEAVEGRNKLVQDIYATVKERAGSQKASTFVTTFGTVNIGTLRFLALRDGTELTFSDQVLSDNVEDYVRSLESADFAIASDEGNAEARDWLPSSKIQGQTLALIRANGDFAQIAAFPTPSGKPYYVFERRRKFSGWKTLSGMGEVEGPYPRLSLPKVRWGLGPESRLVVDAWQGGRMRLVMSCYTYIPNQEITVRLDGKRIALHAMPAVGKVYRFETQVDAVRGRHEIELVYKDWLRDQPSRPLATLFAELRIER